MPREPIEPHQACSVNSVAAQFAHGPSSPNGVTTTVTSAGCAARSSESSNGSDATTTSAAASSACTSASAGPPTTDRFEVLRNSNRAPEPQLRSGSPPAGSTFTTSAPASASSFVQ